MNDIENGYAAFLFHSELKLKKQKRFNFIFSLLSLEAGES
jgi:hypothetical protein